MSELERKPYSSESLRVRCPHCRKLYLVQYGDIVEAKPRFECVQCRNRFWISLSGTDTHGEIQGIPMHVKDAPAAKPKPGAELKTEPCPKCFKPVAVGLHECPSCGVLVQKVKDLSFIEGAPAHSQQLGSAWKKVLSNYDDESIHSDFLRIAQREKNLLYAAAQYGQMNKLMPSDETTLQKMREVQALGTAILPQIEAAKPANLYGRLWQIPLLVASIMIFVGLSLPLFRNIVGVGAALLFLAMAMQIQARRRN
jgi:hypothetical protein